MGFGRFIFYPEEKWQAVGKAAASVLQRRTARNNALRSKTPWVEALRLISDTTSYLFGEPFIVGGQPPDHYRAALAFYHLVLATSMDHRAKQGAMNMVAAAMEGGYRDTEDFLKQSTDEFDNAWRAVANSDVLINQPPPGLEALASTINPDFFGTPDVHPTRRAVHATGVLLSCAVECVDSIGKSIPPANWGLQMDIGTPPPQDPATLECVDWVMRASLNRVKLPGKEPLIQQFGFLSVLPQGRGAQGNRPGVTW